MMEVIKEAIRETLVEQKRSLEFHQHFSKRIREMLKGFVKTIPYISISVVCVIIGLGLAGIVSIFFFSQLLFIIITILVVIASISWILSIIAVSIKFSGLQEKHRQLFEKIGLINPSRNKGESLGITIGLWALLSSVFAIGLIGIRLVSVSTEIPMFISKANDYMAETGNAIKEILKRLPIQ